MRASTRRRRLWTRITAGVVVLLMFLLVVVATHDPRPDLTGEAIRVLEWSLQTQNVK